MTFEFQDATKREVWETLRSLNDCWTRGDGKDLINYFHKNMVAITPTDRDRLEGRKACVAGWSGFASRARIRHWEELDPQIAIHGNTAIVTYYYDMSFEMDGQSIYTGGRDMFVFVKEDGKWWAVADQFSPFPR
jgi:hypothetical protein